MATRRPPDKTTIRALRDAALKLQAMEESILPALTAYRDALDEARQTADTVAEEMSAYIDDRSARWEGSEAGQDYTERMNEILDIAGWSIEDAIDSLLGGDAPSQRILDLPFF